MKRGMEMDIKKINYETNKHNLDKDKIYNEKEKLKILRYKRASL